VRLLFHDLITDKMISELLSSMKLVIPLRQSVSTLTQLWHLIDLRCYRSDRVLPKMGSTDIKA
jgi:hypothetical protein